jgi:hypothetical protein
MGDHSAVGVAQWPLSANACASPRRCRGHRRSRRPRRRTGGGTETALDLGNAAREEAGVVGDKAVRRVRDLFPEQPVRRCPRHVVRGVRAAPLRPCARGGGCTPCREAGVPSAPVLRDLGAEQDARDPPARARPPPYRHPLPHPGPEQLPRCALAPRVPVAEVAARGTHSNFGPGLRNFAARPGPASSKIIDSDAVRVGAAGGRYPARRPGTTQSGHFGRRSPQRNRIEVRHAHRPCHRG